MTARLTKARLKMLMDTAKEGGGHVDIDLTSGKARVVFGQPANEHAAAEDPDEIEARRVQELMNNTRGAAKR